MLKIICSQRDRFRMRIQQLEAEQITAHNMRKDLQHQMKKLRGENIQLYEKLQYVRSMKTPNPNTNTDSKDIEERGAENPFHLFKQRQKEAHFNSLSPYEKLVHMGWEFVFSKNSHRVILFGYCLFLHFLVFVTLWRHTHLPSCPPH